MKKLNLQQSALFLAAQQNTKQATKLIKQNEPYFLIKSKANRNEY